MMAAVGPSRLTLALAFAVSFAAGGAAAWETRTTNPLAEAVDSVLAGEAETGCAALIREQGVTPPPPKLDEAITVCVEPRLSEALSHDDPARRELELLALAAPGQQLAPTAVQLERIETEAGKLPGAIEKGQGRLRMVSYEVRGKHSTNAIRTLIGEASLAMRGCHAQAALADPKLKGLYTLSLHVEPDGSVTGVSEVEGKSSTAEPALRAESGRLTTCLGDVLKARKAAAASGTSDALIEIRIRPVSL